MTWKVWFISVFAALGIGFGFGIYSKGAHEASKTSAAMAQVQQLEVQVEQGLKLRVAQAQDVASARKRAEDSDAHAMKLLAQLNRRPKPLPPIPQIPATGPVVAPAPMPVFPTSDPLKDDVIAALTRDVADQKTLNLKLSAQVATDGVIISNYQKDTALRQIALDAQIAANNSAKWSGRLQGGGAVGIVWAVAHVIAHF